MKRKKLPFNSIQDWSFIFIILFFILCFIHPMFGLFGFVCMFVPMILALTGYGKSHCSHICPRGSFLGFFLQKISLRNKLPKFCRTTLFKALVLSWMMSMFVINIITSWPSVIALASGMFRMMFMSFIIGVVLGIIYIPRSWCQICPMGFGSGLLSNIVSSTKNKRA